MNRALGEKLFFWFALIVGLVLQFYPLFISGFQRTIWDQSDSRLIQYILEHGYQNLIGNALHAHFLSPPVYAPHPGTLAYSELFIGALPIFALFRFFMDSETAYQLWMISVQILSYLSFYFLLTRGFFFRRGAAVFGAFLFAFARFKSAQLGHFQLCLQFYGIFSILCFVLAVRRRSARLYGAGYFLFALQIVTSFYHAWFMALIAFVAGVGLLSRRKSRSEFLAFLRETRGLHLGGALIVVVILAPVLPALLSAKRELGPRAFEEVSQLLPRLSSWLYMGPESLLYGWTSAWEIFRLPMEHEQRLACGWFTMAMLLWGTRRFYREFAPRSYALFLGVAAFLFLWSLQISDYTLWRTIHFTFPAGRSIRGVSRIALWLWIPLIIGLAGTLSRRWDHVGKWVPLLFCWVALEQVATIPSYLKHDPVARAQTIARAIPKDCPVFFYSPTETPDQPHTTHLDAMWASTVAGIPTINGYSGGYPRGWEELYNHRVPNADEEKRVAGELKNWSGLKGLNFRTDCWVKL